MKIIKEGNIEKKVTCSYCNCEYEYDVKDICEDYQISAYSLICPANYERFVCKFVYCPECGEKYYIRKDIKPFVGDYLCSTTQEEQKVDVGRDIPKKPIKIKTDYMEMYACPNCRHSFENTPYCKYCGQALNREGD